MRQMNPVFAGGITNIGVSLHGKSHTIFNEILVSVNGCAWVVIFCPCLSTFGDTY